MPRDERHPPVHLLAVPESVHGYSSTQAMPLLSPLPPLPLLALLSMLASSGATILSLPLPPLPSLPSVLLPLVLNCRDTLPSSSNSPSWLPRKHKAGGETACTQAMLCMLEFSSQAGMSSSGGIARPRAMRVSKAR